MKQRKSTRIIHNSSARRKNNSLDRISALPDSILGLILSYLPTKNAVATSVLSKRWKFVWTTVHNLDFCHNDDWENRVPEVEDMTFVRFVNNVLLLLDGGLLNKFRLAWGPRFVPSQVSTWISAAITRNVHHLSVSVKSCFDYCADSHFEAMEVPVSLFRCDSLQSLELKGCISVSDAIMVCLPRLETLKLGSVGFESEEAFEQLICGCPMLNYLNLDMQVDEMITYSKYNEEFTYIISSTSLRRLEVHVDYAGNDYYFPHLQLEASSLEYLKLDGFIYELFVQGTLSSLIEADCTIMFLVDYFTEDGCNKVAKAVRAFDYAKTLTLSVGVLWALSNATIRLPKFRRLRKLKAGSTSCYCSSVQDFIQSSVNLEVLTIYQNIEYLDAEYPSDPEWTAPVKVPRCLSNSLKVVAYKGYGGCDNEREMIGYMLKHGTALEVMQVTCVKQWSHGAGERWKDLYIKLVEEICRFPRQSPACKVEFIR